jgi:hypothetical protein
MHSSTFGQHFSWLRSVCGLHGNYSSDNSSASCCSSSYFRLDGHSPGAQNFNMPLDECVGVMHSLRRYYMDPSQPLFANHMSATGRELSAGHASPLTALPNPSA